MGILILLFCFSYFIFANIDVYSRDLRFKAGCLIILILILNFIVGLRSFDWPDTGNYLSAFKSMSSDISSKNNLLSYALNKAYYGYGEGGFVLITKLIKIITCDAHIYFLVISSLTFLILYKFLSRYGLYPIIGIYIYIGRFMIFRNMAQIRAALALTIILLAFRYAHSRNFFKYSLIIVIASSFHISALIALPFYFINTYRFSTRQIMIYLGVAALFALFCQTILTGVVQYISAQYGIGQAYVGGTSKYTAGLGLLNPVIYYQSAILLLYSYFSPKLENKVKYYNTIKNGYFMSTLLLISLSPFLVLSGRLSTIFATLEICILPSFIMASSRKRREITILIIGILCAVFLFVNLSKLDF